MLRLALADPEREIRVVDDQVGCPTWSETLARQLRVLVEAEAEGIFHAVAGEATTWYGLARAFLKLMQVEHRLAPCTSAEYPTPARRPANSILLNRRLAEENLLVMRPWREDLAAFVGRYREKLLEEDRAELGKQHV
jgi:dTDP-4-dehydrorhamnose reductase